MGLVDTDEIVRLKSQQTIDSNGNTVEKWKLEVYAANQIRAKRRARVWVRKEVPTARNYLDPDVDTEQSTLKDFFTDTLSLEYYNIEILVVRT